MSAGGASLADDKHVATSSVVVRGGKERSWPCIGRWSISKVGNTGVEDDSKWFPWIS
jgi:hypothetical protein